ncbi:WD40-repeat-containing domain protein [Kockiozyma suomiensis]|uniref:WD40-repeat-containing domain protein n=1 Tax=Kockiozyma suomiensis TaxID=1337062 RepID=UPI003343EF42
MASLGSLHNDVIHDAVLDYYGKRLATCSSDSTIKIFEIEGESHKLIATLAGHEGPVWQVSWAHPKFGVILASSSFDGKVIIWREDVATKTWTNIATHAAHSESVNSVQWAPPDAGAVLVCGSSDGNVSIVEFNDDGNTSAVTVPAHSGAVYAAVWAINDGSSRRFATAGSDSLVKIWHLDSVTNSYTEEVVLEGHSDWIRDLAWAPSVLPKSYLASASEDRTVIVWTQERSDEPWKKTLLSPDPFADTVWKVSWSLSGNVLAVSCGNNKITLWKENLKGGWELCGGIDE